MGDTEGDSLGETVAAAGDLNGDGYDDLFVGAQGGDDGAFNAGEVYVIYGFAPEPYVEAGRVAVGKASADFMVGTRYADNLTGAGGNNVLIGYGGDDILTVSDVGFRRIDGGDGDDRLILSGSGLTLDFTTLSKDVVTDIEAIDITGTGANTVKLTMQDVLDMSSMTDILKVYGNAGDTVNASGFSDTGSNQTIGAKVFDVYTNGAATLWLDQEITNIILS